MAGVKVFPPITGLLLAAAIIIIYLGAEVQAQSFREWRELAERTKRGNKTFDCSPSGSCVTCSYSEKSDEKFQCSETGYRIPYKCIEVQGHFKEVNKEQTGKGSYHVKDGTQSGITNGYKDMELQNQETQKKGNQGNGTGRRERNWRKLSETSYSLEDGKQTYHIFKSCVPPADEEKLGVLGFEGIILCLLLISSPIMYYRKKRNFVMPGATRIPTNSRF